MVKLYEYQGKKLLQENGVSIPEGGVASNPGEAEEVAKELGKPVAVKAQIWVTGRGKAGGIKFACSEKEAKKAADELLGSEIKGLKVKKVLVEEKLDVEREYYVGVVVNDSYKVRSPEVVFSTEGGEDIEEVAEKSPEKIAKFTVDVFHGLRAYDAYNLLLSLNVESSLVRPIGSAVKRIYELFMKFDAGSVEVNPLVLTRKGEIVAADCRITIDDSSVPRHPELGVEIARESDKPLTELERIAWKIEEGDYRGISFFAQMAQDAEEGALIGYHGIGGGGAILGVDALKRQDLKIANYADTSGNPTASKVYRTVKTILAQKKIVGYLLAGFCLANQEQWHHAHGIVKALREELKGRKGFPVVLVIAGNKEKEAREIVEKGLKDLPIRLEVYGREHVYETGFVAGRLKALVREYQGEKRG